MELTAEEATQTLGICGERCLPSNGNEEIHYSLKEIETPSLIVKTESIYVDTSLPQSREQPR